MPTPADLLRRINERHGTGFRLDRRFTRGEQGAFAIHDQSGERFVLKWAPGRQQLDRLKRISVLTGQLRKRGYPAPRYGYLGVVEDCTYSIHEMLPGSPILPSLSPVHLPRLLELNDLQAGLAIDDPGDWPGMIVDTVLAGAAGYCVLDSLRAHSTTTRELLHAVQELVHTRAGTRCESSDAVHFDFNPVNILIADGEISGVIDWDGACAGDRGFDLATLLFYTYEHPELRPRLWRETVERSGVDMAVIYLSHMIVRQVDWSIRHHQPAVIDHWLRIARLVVDDIKPGWSD